MGAPVFTRSFSLLSIGALGALGVLVMLGTWQVQRLAWKESLIARVEAKMAAPAVPLADILKNADTPRASDGDPEYRRTTISGRFDHDGEVFFYTTWSGATGWHVYTPFVTVGDDGEKTLLVNRGFVPADRKDAAARPETRTSGEVTLTGLVRWPDAEKPNSFMPDNDVGANIFFWRELPLMASRAGLEPDNVLPFFVYADETGDGQLPIGSVTIVDFPNNHLAYAVTWYGLALTLIGVYGALLWGRLRSGRKSTSGVT
ncbi:MAG: SURF1 family protein [Pseudomonadota bacterium]